MAIKFNCDCGQTITARDEYAGRKVQCVGCKKVHVVPGERKATTQTAPRPPVPRPPAPLPPKPLPLPPAPPVDVAETMMQDPIAPPPLTEASLTAAPDFEDEPLVPSTPAPPVAAASARTDVLRFRCACGAEFHARPEFAGEPTRCTHCSEVLFIPTRLTAARTDGSPVKVGFDRHDRYRPYRGAESGLMGFLIVLLVLLLMGGGAFAYWEFYLKELPGESKPPQAVVLDGDALATAGNNLKKLAQAVIVYADAHDGQMPPRVILDKDGSTELLSWRVRLLPYLGENELYQKLRLDEAWNSPHNKPLLAKMPKVYAMPGSAGRGGKTAFQVFAGKDTPFPPGKQVVRYPASFTDGTSNTLLIVEGMVPVDWASPGDIFDGPNVEYKKRMGKSANGGTLSVFADGSVRILPADVTEEVLRAYVTPAGGEPVPQP